MNHSPTHLIFVVIIAIFIALKFTVYIFFSDQSEYIQPLGFFEWLSLFIVISIWVVEKNNMLYLYLAFTLIAIITYAAYKGSVFLSIDISIHTIADVVISFVLLLLYIYMYVKHPWKILYRYKRKKHNKSLNLTGV